MTACATEPAPSPPSPEEISLLADFRRLAYGAERPILGDDGEPRRRLDHLAKWEVPVRVALVDDSGGSHRAFAESHLATLRRLTGLDIATAPPETANLLIFFADDPFKAARRHRGLYAHRIVAPAAFDTLLSHMEETATCFGLLWGGWPSGRSIDFSVVFIRTGRGERTVHGCLVQETTQVLGLMHNLEPDANSVFSDSGRQVNLTARDRLLLRVLYDPRLKPGMGWQEVEPLARAVLRDIRAERVVSGG